MGNRCSNKYCYSDALADFRCRRPSPWGIALIWPANEMAQPAPVRSLSFRCPTVTDGAAVWELVQQSGTLEPNTCYAYLLLCTDFADTCLLAERDGELVGFAAAYRPPRRPDCLFVWQIGVHRSARREGLGLRLLQGLIDLPGAAGVRFLEATVAPSNLASRRLFESLARSRGVQCLASRGFVSADFGPLAHEEEELIRIGPLPEE